MNPSLNESSKIFVAGSSWARGEWIGPRVVHQGVIQYFIDAGHSVIDSSQARSYHSRVIALLEKKLTESYKSGDVVLFVLADPLLDIIMPELATTGIKRTFDIGPLPGFTDRIKQAGGLISLVRELQTDIYAKIHALAERFDTQIHLIGGTYNVNTHLMGGFAKLNPLVISWLDLLVGHLCEYSGIADPESGASYTWDLEYIDLTQFDTEFADQVREEFDILTKYNSMLTELIFHPDGLHPNREGHKILYDHLVDLLNL
jgi:hypothetical protein